MTCEDLSSHKVKKSSPQPPPPPLAFTLNDSTSLPPVQDSLTAHSDSCWNDELLDEELIAIAKDTRVPEPNSGDDDVSSIEAARPKSVTRSGVGECIEQDLEYDDEPDVVLKPWMRATFAMAFFLVRVWWNTFAEILRTCGLGRSPDTCVTFRQRLWLFINTRIVEDYIDFTLEPATARQFQAELTDDPSQIKPRALLLRCPLLTMVGERPLMWDACQRLAFLSSNGRFVAERHGAVTKDGHLLIVHHIVRIPEAVVSKLQPMTQVSVCRCVLVCFMRILRSWFSPSPACWRVASGRTTEKAPASVQATASADSLPELSTTTTMPSTEEARTRWAAERRSSSPLQKPQVAIFQHGLLESSTNWLAAAAPVDDDHAWTMENSLVWFRWLWRELEDFGRMMRRIVVDRKSPFESLGPGPRPDSDLRQALPFYLMLSADRASNAGRVTRNGTNGHIDVWLGNSRGNCYTRLPPQPDMEDNKPPMGYRSAQLNELLAYAEVFGQNWTYHDMAILDVDVLFERVACLTQNKTWALPVGGNHDVNHFQEDPAGGNEFRPICLGFSQGAATFLLYTAFKQKLDAFLEERRLPPSSLSTVLPSQMFLFSPPVALSPHNSTATALFQNDRSVSAARRSNSCLSSGLRLAPPTYRKSVRLSKAEEHWTVTQARAVVNWLIPVDRMVAFFFYMAKKRLGFVAVFVELLCTMMPNSIYPWLGHFFVREMLQFYTDPLTPASRRWLYPLTPSGLTSHKNMDLYMNRIVTGEPLGYRFGTHVTWPIPIHSDQDVNRAIEDHFSHRLMHLETIKLSSDVCPIGMWLGRLDNIAWPERSAEVALTEVAHAVVERVPLLNSGRYEKLRSFAMIKPDASPGGAVSPLLRGFTKTQSGPVVNEALVYKKDSGATRRPPNPPSDSACVTGHDVKVRLMEGLGHLDFVWGSQRCKDVYPVVWKEVERSLYH